ncbi:MFS transporter [Cupriavidus sp. TMH.W2]|uniref:MFS transporter n=1 Tax=Cupriavidus sp. TMH.W2 TaxID=3434465 RepID=UPI003D772B35
MQSTSPTAASLAVSRSSVRWKIFLMLLLLVAINYIDRASLSVAMPLIAREFDLSPAMQGLILSSFFLTYAFMPVPGSMLADKWKEAGGRPNVVMRTLFGIAAVVAMVSIFSVAYVTDPVVVVVLLSSTLFFLRWCGLFWSVPSMLGTRNKAGFLGGVMNLGGNIAGISVPIIVGLIVQATGSYFLELMFFAVCGVGLLLASTSIDYEKKIPV